MAFEAAWRSAFPDFRIIGNAEVLGVIAAHFPAHLETFGKIAIRLNDALFTPACERTILRPEYDGRILIMREEDTPMRRNMHRSYGGPGEHWSERQRREPLFVR